MNEKLTALLESVRNTAIQAGSVAEDVAYVVGKGAEKALSEAKVRLRIMDRKAEINCAMREVGQMLYATHTGDPTDSETLLEKLQEIDALYAEIQALEERLG